MLIFAQAHNDILDRSHTVAFSVAYRATQDLREIERLWTCSGFFHSKGMIARGLRTKVWTSTGKSVALPGTILLVAVSKQIEVERNSLRVRQPYSVLSSSQTQNDCKPARWRARVKAIRRMCPPAFRFSPAFVVAKW